MKRREFIASVGGALAMWPFAARAQQPERVRRIGVLLLAAADDAEYQARVGAFLQALALLGWTIGRNLRIEIRWSTTDAGDIRRHAEELAALAPDVILGHGTSAVRALSQATRAVPIVFPVAGDPVGAGIVASLARPGSNVTGFMNFEFSMGGKWLELLKQIAPAVTRVAVLRDTNEGLGTSQFAVIQAMAPSLRAEVSPLNMRGAAEIERAVEAFAHAALASGASGQRGDSPVGAHSASGDARKRADDTRPGPGSSARAPNGGLIVTAGGAASLHRDLIVTLAARHKLPAVYFERAFVAAGGPGLLWA